MTGDPQMTARAFLLTQDGLKPAPALASGGLVHGYGIFESFRTYNGRLFELPAHLARMRAGATNLRLAGPPDDNTVRDSCLQALTEAELPDARLRLVLVASTGGATLWTHESNLPSVFFIQIEPLDPNLHALREAGVTAVTSSSRVNEHSATAGLKTIGYAAHFVTKHEAVRAGAYEGIILNCLGDVVEGSMSNIFIASEGALLTPALACGPLPGVTRSVAIGLARDTGIACTEGRLHPKDITAADECFLTSSVSEIMPVLRFDDAQIGDGKPGPITRCLQESYGRLTAAL